MLCMSACALYVAGMPDQRLSSSSEEGGSCVPLTQLLRATHIRYLARRYWLQPNAKPLPKADPLFFPLPLLDTRLIDFFDPLRSFISNLKLGPKQEEHLLQLERKFCVICILYKKYEKEFFNLFHITGGMQPG